MITSTENGLYDSGQTFLYRLDPRVKVLSCLLLVVLTFAATGWSELLPLLVTIGITAWLTSPQAASLWRVCWALRWLLLFTLLMHLLLSSGRTLWGIRWLSLDGLLTGFFISVQMLMAIMVSALLAITTSTETLSRTFGWFMQPLQWLGCKTEEWQKILLLTMDFVPVVQQEIRACATPDGGIPAAGGTSQSDAGRWSVWSQKLHGLLLRLVDRGDMIAHRIAGEQNTLRFPGSLPPLMPMALYDQLFCLAMTLVVVCYWFAG
ncbi:MAG: CbiQ family ECF transporter T component [Desulfuromonadales bacterium]|nr:CbiQ family ECF transporter T component [Desulfuromonadales bacterium]